MVHKYKRKTNQQSWEENDMRAALTAVRQGAGINAAARLHNIPVATLFRRLKKPVEEETAKVLGRYRPVFSVEQEKILVKYLLEMEARLFGLTKSDLRYLAFQYADRNNIPHSFNKEERKAGKDWVHAFLRRNPELSLRLPEKTSAARASAFNEVNVNKFFDLLEHLFETHRYNPDNIYNCDETGITTVPNRPSKIISAKGKKQVGVLSSAERGTLVTAEICFSATGKYIPPALIFPRVRINPMFEKGAPPNTKIFAHQSGWMQSEIFVEWFKHFLKYSKPTAEERVLLILDGHATHINNLDVLLLAKENYVDILVLPPHSTHRLQPLDVAFMYPLSTYYEQAVRVWLREHPGKVVTIHEIGALFGNAYAKAATLQNAISGFRKTGIYPFERVFPKEYFSAAETTNRLPTKEVQIGTPSTSTSSAKDLPTKNLVSPYDILTIPQVEKTIDGSNEPLRRKSRCGTTVVATSSPFVQELKRKKESVNDVSNRKTKKVKKQLFASDSESDASLQLDDSDSEYAESFSADEDRVDKISSPKTNQIITAEIVIEGSWIAVMYQGDLYPGLVVKKSSESVTVKCMEKTQKFFRWPLKEDLMEYSYGDIHLIIEEPRQLRRGFFHVPELCLFVD